MHLLVGAHDFYPDPGSGGTGRYVHETARRLADRGHDVSVLTRRRGDVSARETVAGVRVARYDLSVAGESAPKIATQLPDAARTVRDHLDALPDPNELRFLLSLLVALPVHVFPAIAAEASVRFVVSRRGPPEAGRHARQFSRPTTPLLGAS